MQTENITYSEMLTPKFRELLEQYHRQKWFPHKYPDPFGEFIDFISEGMIHDLHEDWRKTGQRSSLSVAAYILEILPTIQFGDLYQSLRNQMRNQLVADQAVSPETVFYYLRIFSDLQSAGLWQKFREWCVESKSVFVEWLQVVLRLESKFIEFLKAHTEAFDLQQDFSKLEETLIVTRDFFEFQLKRNGVPRNLRSLLQYFRIQENETFVDWKDLAAFLKNFAEVCHIIRTPGIQRSENDALLLLFPIAPPERVILEHAKITGPYDFLRFLHELGKGLFYSGMDPDLPAELRICGDPSVPPFWGFLYSHLLSDRYGLSRLIGSRAEPVSDKMKFALEFSFRYSSALAIYRARVSPDLKNAEDLYVETMEKAFPWDPSPFLYLYDLYRSSDALFHVKAQQGAIAGIDRLSSMRGQDWFASSNVSKRLREYWREGFRLSFSEVLKDLNAQVSADYPFYL